MAIQSIDGLASNLNTTEIIDALMAAERQPATIMEDQKYRKTLEISNFKALAAKLIALQSSMNTLNNKKTFSDATVSVSDSDFLTATADSAIGLGSYSLNILSLAQNHQIASQGFDDATAMNLGTGSITVALGNASPTTIQIGNGQNSLVGIKDAINKAKLGITASIINDGSDSNSYRLLLTGKATGAENTISFTSDLTGGGSPDFSTSSFDNPETGRFSSQATSTVSLGATAGFTGSTNKKYTFTIGGSGVQTVGSGNITVNWSDGTNTGSIVVSQADTEIIGPDGLKLSFADGDLVAGDTFSVSTFAPLLQQAADAQVSVGSTIGGASPIIISSSTNTFEDVVPGMRIDVKKITTESSGPVSISTGFNSQGVVDKLQAFINAYNGVMEFINEQHKYNADTKEAGILMGDITLQTIQSRLSGLVSIPIAGLDKSLNALSAIGIRFDSDGKLALKSSSKLTQALENDYEAVMKLFVDSGSSDSNAITFLSGADEVTGGDEFEIDITQVATHGYYKGSVMNSPSAENLILTETNNNLQLRVDGRLSDVLTLSARTYSSTADLVNELQTRVDQDEKIGTMGVTVEWVDLGNDQGYLKLNSSSYGSSSKVELYSSVTNSAFADLNLSEGSLTVGLDVAGTINGQAATGQGQVLEADKNTDAAGLKLQITVTAADLVTGSEGTITITKGVASVLRDKLESITKSGDGILDAKTSALQKQVDNIDAQIKALDDRLAIRRKTLMLEFAQLEMTLSQLQSESSFLETQLANISSNMSKITGKG